MAVDSDLKVGASEFHAKGMPFRTLGSSGLRVPLFSVGTCPCSIFGMADSSRG